MQEEKFDVKTIIVMSSDEDQPVDASADRRGVDKITEIGELYLIYIFPIKYSIV